MPHWSEAALLAYPLARGVYEIPSDGRSTSVYLVAEDGCGRRLAQATVPREVRDETIILLRAVLDCVAAPPPSSPPPPSLRLLR